MVIETMRAEWGCTLRQALFEESLPAAIALWPALTERHGGEAPQREDHISRARQAAKDKARAWLEANYRIVPTPKRVPRNSPPPPSEMVLDARG